MRRLFKLLPLLLLLALGAGVGVVAWSITVREDLGSPSPRQHMRYLEPLLVPLLLVTLDALLYLLLYVFGFAFAFYPLTRWCKANEGFSWPWPHVKSEKKRIRELRKEQEQQEKK